MDWIDRYMEYTDGIPSPEIFRLWSGISTLAGALERRVWISTSRSVLFPNLFVLLVAPPAVGKSQAIVNVSELWYATKKFKIAPDNVTKASLIDALDAADGKRIAPGGALIEYHSLLTASSEFGVLVPAHDLEFLSVLNHIYDNPRTYRENRRSLHKNIEIVNPQLNIIAGTQPGFLASLLPEEAWSMGFTSRIIMVYSAMPIVVSLFKKQDSREHLFKVLTAELVHFANVMGEAQWDEDAQQELERWAQGGCEPIPTHSKLQHYTGRRILHVLKLSLISAISRSSTPHITLWDVNRARDWLLHAEILMPDIFRDMSLKSDSQVILELHWFMWQLWLKTKKPIHEGRAIHFLQQRLPAEKVERVLDIAVKSGILKKTDTAVGPAYEPRPSHEHGAE